MIIYYADKEYRTAKAAIKNAKEKHTTCIRTIVPNYSYQRVRHEFYTGRIWLPIDAYHKAEVL